MIDPPKYRYLIWPLLITSFVFYNFFGYSLERQEFSLLVFGYIILFTAYFYLISKELSAKDLRLLLFAAIAFRLTFLFSIPALSDDFYRFIWDGKIALKGINPFSFTPEQLHASSDMDHPNLFSKLNSQGFHTVYPPVLQYIFYVSAWLAQDNFLLNIIFLRLFILLSEFGSIYLIYKLCDHFKIKPERSLLYALNPLVIIELTGNLHFEALMIFFTLLAVLLLIKNRKVFSAVAFGLAAGTKLIPLIFLPFLVKRIGWKNSLYTWSITGLTFLLLFAPFFQESLISNFFSSLKLYFQYFEFNASIYYIIKFFISDDLAKSGLLAGLTAISIIYLALKERGSHLQSLLLMMLGTYFFYLMGTTTVHPWYIAPLIAFGIFTNFRFVVIWSFLIPLTYITYSSIPYEQNYPLIAAIYLIILSVFITEYIRLYGGSRKGALLRADIKWQRIRNYLHKEDQVLEIGAGNCGVTEIMTQNKIAVTPVDIKNKSFFKNIQPVIYDGRQLPFNNEQFDVGQVLTVLHHTHDPELIISEVSRVAKRVIIMEDIYTNTFQKYLTYLVDSLVNLEFAGHPHNNKSDQDWRQIFKKNGLKIVDAQYHRFLLFFLQVTYYLEKETDTSKKYDAKASQAVNTTEA